MWSSLRPEVRRDRAEVELHQRLSYGTHGSKETFEQRRRENTCCCQWSVIANDFSCNKDQTADRFV